MADKIKIAVSACLLGQKVRYDAQEKGHELIINYFMQQHSDILELLPFCPEVAIGLSVPRAKIQLQQEKDKTIRVVGVENHRLDVTSELQSYAERFLLQQPDIRAYIVKSKSPSCAYQSSPVFFGTKQTGLSSGMFVQTLKKIKSELLIIEETQLDSEQACLTLLQQIQKLC